MAMSATCNPLGRVPGEPCDLRLNLLGGFSVTAGGQTCDVADSCKRLLVFLALQECPQGRAVVAGSLWPEKAEARALANLRSSLWRMPEPLGLPLVRACGSNLRLAESLDVDVRLVEAAGWMLLRDPGRGIDDLDPRMFMVELLPGWYDDWVIFERERIAQLQLHFLEALAYELIERRRLAQALDVALRLVNADPYRESSQRALLAVHRADRNVGQAHRQIERYRKLIRDTFGCEPSSSLLSLGTVDD